jgi:type IV pilus assembly protein PilB
VVALSKQLNMPTVDLDKVEAQTNTIELVTGEYAEHYGIVPIKVSGKFLDVAMTDPTNLGVMDELRIRTQLNVRPYIAGPKAMERALQRWYGRGVNPLAKPLSGETFFPDGMRMIDMDSQSMKAVEATPAPGRPPGPTMPPQQGPQTSLPTMPTMPSMPVMSGPSTPEIEALQRRIAKLEAYVNRDEEVLRKLLALLVEKGIASREEILERLK